MSLANISPTQSAAVRQVIPDEFGSCNDWTPRLLYNTIVRVVSLASGAVFVGPELCGNEDFIRASADYTAATFRARTAIKAWPKWTRWIGQYFIPELKTLFECRARCKELLVPVIRKRSQMSKDGEVVPNDLLQWSVDSAEDFGLMNEDVLASIQFEVNLASTNNVTLAVVET